MIKRLESRRGGRALVAVALALAAAATSSPASAQSAVDEIQRYRQMLQDGNPAELLVIRGEDLWRQPRGPNKVSLQKCDLGLGPGVVKGAYARLPRYFDDAKRVMDLESRLVYCQVTLQGFKEEEVTKAPFSGGGQRQTDNEALVAFIVERSRGETIQVSQSHPMEKDAYARGKQLFYYRGGPFYFSCATCHSEDDKRIRLQDLPNLEKPGPAQRAYATWPAYRVSQGAMRTMQWRIYDCFRQQRFPELKFTSQASVDLITYLAVNANGGKMDAPAIKR
jgi:sulfur-oxidizing protein SoxA